MSTREAVRAPAAAANSVPATAEVRVAELATRAAQLTAALDAAGDLVDPAISARAGADLAAVAARLELGADHTVVALVGGTGSGKSSLFNAISGLEFADVGELRPTTEVAAACVWGGDAEALLDFIDVSHERRIQRESVLDGDRERALRGMVLLDLPDHDSIALEHAQRVDRLLPLVDLLVWVVDPQKYADDALHDRYLKALAGRRDNMLVLVNQADTLPPGAAERVRDDVAELLAADGLPGVPVLLTSALEHTGIGEVRRVLGETVGRASAAVSTAAAQLDALVVRLEPEVGPGPVELEDPARVTEALSRAAGVEAVAASARTAIEAPAGGAVASPEPPADATVAAIRDGWLAGAQQGLPTRWAAAVAQAVTPAGPLGKTVAQGVAEVPLPPSRSSTGFRLMTVAGALAAAAALYLVLALVLDLTWPVVLVPALLAFLVAVVLVPRSAAVRRREAEQEAARYRTQVHERVATVVDELLVRPTTAVLDRHRALRDALEP